jgi:hypothetical protein
VAVFYDPGFVLIFKFVAPVDYILSGPLEVVIEISQPNHDLYSRVVAHLVDLPVSRDCLVFGVLGNILI